MKKVFPVVAAVVMLMLTTATTACKSNNTTTTTSTAALLGRGAVINSDSIVIAQIQNITAQSTGYPWKITVLIQSTSNVGTLPNPVANSAGKMVTVITDQDVTTYKVNDTITAKIKYTGDVNTPGGISMYMYNIALEVKPQGY